ncbi:MAG: hypothetical protein RR710_04005 [Oscillospiraceae bacterium]
MYKILTLVRKTSGQTLWEFLMVTVTNLIDDPNKLPDKITGVIPQIEVTTIEEYQTSNLIELEDKIKEILLTMPINNIRIIQDVTYNIDILF